jgi:uncharacterized integral membrane protein
MVLRAPSQQLTLNAVTTPEPRPAGVPGTDPTVGFPGAGPSGPAGTTAPSADGPPSAPAQQPTRHTGRTIGRTVALALLVFVTIVLVLFVVFNTQTVDISLVFTDVNAPLVLALVIAAILGGLVAILFNAVMTVRGRRRNR